MIKAALIGVSSYGRVHLRMIDYMVSKHKLELVAATVINQEEEEDQCAKLRAQGCELFRDYKEMLRVWRGRLDLCMIPTPIFLHEEMTLAALEAKANVLIEKPLAPSTEACARIMERAAEVDRFVAVGFQKMYSAATRKIKRDLLAGVLGEIREIRGITLWPRGVSYFSRNSWAGKVRLGNSLVLDSPVSNATAHFLHLMLFWAGDALNSVASIVDHFEAETYRANDIENFDTASLRGLTGTGIPVSFIASHASRETVDPMVRIIGTKGEIEWIKDEGAYYRVEGEPERRIDLSSEEEEVRIMIEEIGHQLSGGVSWLCGPEQAIPQVEVVESLHRGCETIGIPDEYLEEFAKDGDTFRAIRGLESIAINAFERGVLLSEAGAPWKTASQVPSSK
ncbi:Gfo/Idh/MocA family oxidoreductase [Pelagicoccus sp. SDUM812002]|uniref:Gfo/Idh/MocA family protein n=1 Tax=Pelagicoccus sp. SDUM812002 TaxID=3041266 RepID=UPI0028102BDB|nr:Gfo/Idh/MocA family oxidoreductase [Pelagicoccus sp. SDUM812002]MDQ8187720.1 Gfo/Idh/MocA family oxidoreductase [Pelagicoccus sp. SDUM812002]